MKFVIPSYNRLDILKSRTLALLEKHKIPKNSIYIFVVREEHSKYHKGLHLEYNIVIGKKGISNQRAFISEYFDDHEPLISLDDDVREIYSLYKNCLGKKAIEPIKDLKKMIKSTFHLMDVQKIRMCGFYPVKNPFFMKFDISYDLKFCIGQFRLFYNIKDIEMNRKYKLLEDYETTLKYYLWDDGHIMRRNNICMDADYNKLPGGLKETADRSYEEKKKEVEEFNHDYWVYSFIKEKGNKIDIGLKAKTSEFNIWT